MNSTSLTVKFPMNAADAEQYLLRLYGTESSKRIRKEKMTVFFTTLFPGMILVQIVASWAWSLVFSSGATTALDMGTLVSGVIQGTVIALMIIAFTWGQTLAPPEKLAKHYSGSAVEIFRETTVEITPDGIVARKPKTSRNIAWKKVTEVYLLADAYYFLIDSTRTRALIVPLSAFESQEQIDEALELIRSYWHGEIRTN